MGIVLFDRKASTTTGKFVTGSFSVASLFDGYLTEPTSFPQLQEPAYLTGKAENKPTQNRKAYRQKVSLFDGYLTDPKTESQWK